jgi:actin-related protein 3
MFLGPEAFFSPELIDKDWTTPIDELIDNTVQQCPIDYRRRLYSVNFIDLEYRTIWWFYII